MAKANGPKPREVITRDSIDNAFVLDMAMGGSTNTVLHTLAVANEAGIAYDLERINQLSKITPNICKVSPSSSFHIEDVRDAGGITGASIAPAITPLRQLEGGMHPAQTCSAAVPSCLPAGMDLDIATA